MKQQILVAGVDVSKDTLDVYYNDLEGGEHALRVSNDNKGHRQLVECLGLKRCYVLESSGPYYLNFAFYVKKQGGTLRVENPIRIKRFIQMNLERNKTDRKDARWIYRYGRSSSGKPWQLPHKAHLDCQTLVNVIELYKRQLVMIQNQLHSLAHLPVICKQAQASLHFMEQELQAQIKHLELRLEKQLHHWQALQWRNLNAIPGLGKRAVAMLIIYTDGFSKVINHRQLTALVGLSPREFSSGSSIRSKKGICKMGNARLRSILYMCSLSAIRYNKACRELYERLKAKGKNGKLALIAVCNKLLKQAFAIATKATTYQENYKTNFG